MKTVTRGRSGYRYFYQQLRATNGNWRPPFDRLRDTREWCGAYASYISQQCMRFSGVVR